MPDDLTDFERPDEGGIAVERTPRPETPTPTADPATPAGPTRRQFGNRYEVVRELGKGGMGIVYEARDTKLNNQTVAVKVSRRLADEHNLSQLKDEVDKMAALSGTDNILKVTDWGYDREDGGSAVKPFIVMEYAPGGSLAEALGNQPQRPKLAAEVTEALARAVQVVHDHGLIHRDLKPQNVLLAKAGPLHPAALRLTDFGVARVLADVARLEVVGTPDYMAPEQTRPGEPLTAAVDVYALGAVLYEMLTGRTPFPAAALDASSKGPSDNSAQKSRTPPPEANSRRITRADHFERIRWGEPIPPRKLIPNLPWRLEVICLKCLRKAPGERYPTAAALADDLHRYLAGESILARPAPVWERPALWVRRRPWQAALAAAVAAGGVAAAVAGSIYLNQRRTAEIKRQLDEEYAKSLEALNGIRDLLVDGSLSRVEGLESLNDQLVGYYEAAAGRGKENADPRPLAESWDKLGRLVGRTGNKSKAVTTLAKAVELYDGLTAPTKEDHRALALILLKRGKWLSEVGEFGDAEVALDKAHATFDKLAAADPTAARDADLGRAEVWHLRGERLGRQVRREEAVVAYQRALQIRSHHRPPAGETNPASLPVLQDYARTNGYLGDVYLDMKDNGAADRVYWESHRVREKVYEAYQAAAVRNGDLRQAATDAKFQFARSWFNLANFQARNRAAGSAAHFAAEGFKLLDQIIEDNPNVGEYKSDLGLAKNRQAELGLRSAGTGVPSAETFEALSKAEQVFRKLNERDKKDLSAARGLGTTHALYAAALANDPDQRAKVAKRAADARAILEGLIRDKKDPTPDTLFYLALALAADPGTDPKAAANASLDALDRAVRAGYRGWHPDDVKTLDAFRRVGERDAEKFEDVIRRMAKPPTAGGT